MATVVAPYAQTSLPSAPGDPVSVWSLGNWNSKAGTVASQTDAVTFSENPETTYHGIEQDINVPASSFWQLSFEVKTTLARSGVRIHIIDPNDRTSGSYVASVCNTSAYPAMVSWRGSSAAVVTKSATAITQGWTRCVLGARFLNSATPSRLQLGIYVEKGNAVSYGGDLNKGFEIRNTTLSGQFSFPASTHITLQSDVVRTLFPLREGFGADATGGLNGDLYTVTTLQDTNEPGSLRFAAEDPSGKAYWIRFDPAVRGGTISLREPLYVGSNKTIDGRDSNVTVTNHGIIIGNGVKNVIIANLAVRNVIDHDEDNISIYGLAHDVWIHRVSLSGKDSDGLLDITDGATDVTVDWSRFSDHDKVMIINSYPTTGLPSGGEKVNSHSLDFYDRDKNVRVTLHHNVFLGTTQRHPRSVFGKIHMYNNVLKDWGGYGIASSFRAQTLVEGNVFDSNGVYANRALITQVGVDPEPGFLKFSNNLFLGAATSTSSGAANVFTPPYTYRCEMPSEDFEAGLLRTAGIEGDDDSINVASFGSDCRTAANKMPVRPADPVIPPVPTTPVTTTPPITPTIKSANFTYTSVAYDWLATLGATIWPFTQDTSTGSHQISKYMPLPNEVSLRDTLRFSIHIQPFGANAPAALLLYVMNSNDQSNHYGAMQCTLNARDVAVAWKSPEATNLTFNESKNSDGSYDCAVEVAPGGAGTDLRLAINMVDASGKSSFKGDGASGVVLSNLVLGTKPASTADGGSQFLLRAQLAALAAVLEIILAQISAIF